MDPNRGAGLLLGICIALTTAQYFVPFGTEIGYPLVLISTVAHELGHGLTALAWGADFERLVIEPDTSGYAQYSGRLGRIATATISAGGLLGPAVVSFLCFRLGRSPHAAKGLHVAFALVLLLVLIFVDTNWFFGTAVILTLAALHILCVIYGSPWLLRFGILFAGVQLALSVYTRGDYLFVDYIGGDPNRPSDVQVIADALFLPYWFWGAACGLGSIVILIQGLKPWFRKGAATRAPKKSATPE